MRADALTAPVLSLLREPGHAAHGLSAKELYVPLSSDLLSVEIELQQLGSKGLVAKSGMFERDDRYKIMRDGREWLDDRNEKLRQKTKTEKTLREANIRAWVAIGISAGALTVAILALILK